MSHIAEELVPSSHFQPSLFLPTGSLCELQQVSDGIVLGLFGLFFSAVILCVHSITPAACNRSLLKPKRCLRQCLELGRTN